jgi:hypothetical protein
MTLIFSNTVDSLEPLGKFGLYRLVRDCYFRWVNNRKLDGISTWHEVCLAVFFEQLKSLF